jgi:hypothetical protein
MPSSSLTEQTDREIRYDHRCHKQKISQQNMARDMRFEKREAMLSEISSEVNNEISMVIRQKRSVPDRTSGRVKGFSSYFF